MPKNVEVELLHNQFPDLTANDIAELMECSTAYIRATCQRMDLRPASFEANLAGMQKRNDAMLAAKKFIADGDYIKILEDAYKARRRKFSPSTRDEE